MKILYVSDLDGTLLDNTEKVSSYSIAHINKLICDGCNFTISTGRGDSVKKILEDIQLQLPIMILNGALNYDFINKKYVDAKEINTEKVLYIKKKLEKCNLQKFEIRTFANNQLKRFEICNWDEKSACLGIDLVDTKEKMKEVSLVLNEIREINFFIHKCVYSDNEWFCNIAPKNVSKASSLKSFKEKYNYDKIIAFGDSENDLPLAEVADEFYAVANAAEIVKKKATAVIGSSMDDGVVKFIMEKVKEA